MANAERVPSMADGLLAEYDRLHAVYRMTAALIRTESPQEVYREALAALRHALGATRASVLVFDDAGVMRFVDWLGLGGTLTARSEPGRGSEFTLRLPLSPPGSRA